MLKPYKVDTALQSVYFGTKPKRTVVYNQFANYAETLKGENKPYTDGTPTPSFKVCSLRQEI